MPMSTRTHVATTRFLSGYNCAQAVLDAFRDEAGLDEDLALKIATGLGAGMGRKQEVCGAVTGGILVLGLRHGRGSRDDQAVTGTTYARVRELMDRFAAKHGTCLCRELLRGYNLATEEGLPRAKADDLLHKVCRPCVQTIVEILEQMK
jgi:C_GCAxxG_C_C family probable redox protein